MIFFKRVSATYSQSLQRHGDPAERVGVLTHWQRRHLGTTLQHGIELGAKIYNLGRETDNFCKHI